MMKHLIRVVMILAGCFAVVSARLQADERDDFFETKIRPVLAGTCYTCHGAAKTSGELRIDSRDSLLVGGESGPAIVPGRPDDSLLIRAIQRQDGVSAMPPELDKVLRPEQVADFATWIKQGAAWPAASAKFQAETPWALAPIQDPALPGVRDAAWVRSSVDAFIRARQEAAEVDPVAAADKLALIRRATFDLTGLPPTPSDVAAFVNDTSPRAFETVVDRLLESPAYGERWGRHWLDLVRYADTAGETADYPVPLAWRYRNYVIEAFRADKPYDEFLREQIAGDVLANQGPRDRYAERVTATGYLAISRRFGFDSENYHHLTIQDTIDNVGQTVLGLSLGCARCHDHKFDAVSMRDYYGLYGIFDSSRYAFPGSEQKQKVRSLAPLIPPRESQPQWREYEQRVASLVRRLTEQQQPVPAAVLRSLSEIDGDFELQAVAAGGSNGVLVSPWLYEGKIAVTNAAQSPFKNLYALGKVGASVPADAGRYRIAQAIYPRRTSTSDERVYLNLDFRVAATDPAAQGVHRLALGEIGGVPAVEILISAQSITMRMGQRVQSLRALVPNQWHNLQLTLDLRERTISGRVGAPGDVNELAQLPAAADWTGAVDFVVFDTDSSSPLTLPPIEYDNLGVQNVPIEPVSTEPIKSLTDDLGADRVALTEALQRARQELETLLIDGPFAMTYGMAEGAPHNVRMQLRGEPDQPGDEVPRGLIQSLGGSSLPADTVGSGRLELAQWLTRPDHPLTARVMVNRIWQYHFGRGLVKTPNDFGVRGLPPTHPELLDHLAVQFIRSGWSIKAMHRLMMLSATYQQASMTGSTTTSPSTSTTLPAATVADSAASATRDLTDLYVGFPRRRLSAEEIRDAMLAVSGELDLTTPQQHPFPSPISWGYSQHGPFNAVYEHNHRSIYLMTQRIRRHPFLALFDGADPNGTTAERRGTTVPTQALFFLNDPFVHAQAEKWANRLQSAGAEPSAQIELAYLQALGRVPSEDERTEAAEFLATYRAELAAEGLAAAPTRALAAYLRALLGSNEFLHVD